jgi:hypothetical protein
MSEKDAPGMTGTPQGCRYSSAAHIHSTISYPANTTAILSVECPLLRSVYSGYGLAATVLSSLVLLK